MVVACPIPSDKSLGYFHKSLRDKDFSQNFFLSQCHLAGGLVLRIARPLRLRRLIYECATGSLSASGTSFGLSVLQDAHNRLEISFKHVGCSLLEVAGIIEEADGVFFSRTLKYIETAIALADSPEI